MWIMLNNRPLDISKIERISEVITLDSKCFVKQREFSWSDYAKPEFDFYKLKLPEELCKTPFEVLKEDAKKDNKIWGYFFCIKEITAVQCYLNSHMNGVNYKIDERYSKVYSTKESAQAAIDHLLFEMNEIYNKLVKIEI